MDSRDNILSKKAFNFIDKCKGKDNAADIRTELEGLPAKIKINGLPQTLIFLLEKSKTDNSGNEQNDRYMIGKELVEYLAKKELDKDKTTNYPSEAYKLCEKNLRHATIEAVAYTAWLKRMAKAIIPKKDNSNTNTEVSNEN
ncbi:type III-B CRISPR module-associated protein Cmr5 [Maridesulfovibrio hydrothermalis]|uniref:CRISPR type III-B/RAMP module-associated protein Cmr5 n=1 Tax=Maridesulfovibrio hydrothermalis AM13 = DSM 14728 TaxID=1121451 RepID=L0R732_9BACT|nr:type III-B CRISPR module-associated protein Cmr5 [Maridesulfovibrio hydrothermalis]CCO22022.1 putative CRISPR-associated protein, Cmr5 family [Maridesulfovibrio hydrothermalis AM13 = DSM 14728]